MTNGSVINQDAYRYLKAHYKDFPNGRINTANKVYNSIKPHADNTTFLAVIKKYKGLSFSGSNNSPPWYFFESSPNDPFNANGFDIIGLPRSNSWSEESEDPDYKNTLSYSYILDSIDTSKTSATKNQRVGYVSSWNTDRPITISQANYFSYLVFAYAELQADGSLVIGSTSRLKDVVEAKRQEIASGGQVKIMIAVGGWDRAAYFTSVANVPSIRSLFLAQLQNIIEIYELDGVDIHWELPVSNMGFDGTSEEKENVLIFYSAVRKSLELWMIFSDA